MFCSNCGKEISEQAKFCKYCGAKTEKIQQEMPLIINKKIEPIDRKKPCVREVTIIAWFLIVIFGGNFVLWFMDGGLIDLLINRIVASEFLYRLWWVSNVISAIAMLKGLNWGRLLFLYSFPIIPIIKWLLFSRGEDISLIVMPLGIYIIMFMFLRRPNVLAFFLSNGETRKK